MAISYTTLGAARMEICEVFPAGTPVDDTGIDCDVFETAVIFLLGMFDGAIIAGTPAELVDLLEDLLGKARRLAVVNGPVERQPGTGIAERNERD